MAYGTSLANIYSVTCPDGSTVVFWDECPGYGTWGEFAIGRWNNMVETTIAGTYLGDDGHESEEDDSSGRDEMHDVETDEEKYSCRDYANTLMTAGGVMSASGFLLASRAPSQTIGTDWKAFPVYDQSGYLYDDIYWDVNGISQTEGSDPHIGDAFGFGLGMAGAVVIVLGGATHAGCFLVN